MGAFCVYGISKSHCKDQATKKTVVRRATDQGKAQTVEEWAANRDTLAEKLFAESDKRVKISPEFDAPQFCRDWIAINPSEIKQPLIMARAEKTDSKGEIVLRGGVPVMTWVEYKEAPKGLF